MRNADISSQIESWFAKNANVPLVSICDQFEDFLQNLMKSNLLEDLRRFSAGEETPFAILSPRRFLFSKELFEIKLTECPSNHTVIRLTIHNVDAIRSTLADKPISLHINGWGRYTEIEFCIEAELQRFEDALSATACAVFESGYRSLSEFIRLTLDECQNKVANDLYSHLRLVLPEQLVENVFLYGVVKEQGLYLIDDLTRRVALYRASLRKYPVTLSPLEIAANFATTSVELGKLLSKHAIAENKTIVGDFNRAAYMDSGHHIAQTVVYQGLSFATTPIVRDGEALMVAGYPAEMRDDVEPVLMQERGNLRDILEKGSSSLHETVRQIFRHGNPFVEGGADETALNRWLEHVELKPNVAGFGLNINSILKNFFRNREKRKKLIDRR